MEKFTESKYFIRLAWISGILTLLLTMALSYIDQPLRTPEAPHGIVSFEVAGSFNNAQKIISSWNENAKIYAGLSLGIDFLYMVSYSVFIAILIFSTALKQVSKYPLLYRFGAILAGMQFLAAALDSVENYSLIRLLLGSSNQIFASIAYFCATIKFTLIITGVLYFVVIKIFTKFTAEDSAA